MTPPLRPTFRLALLLAAAIPAAVGAQVAATPRANLAEAPRGLLIGGAIGAPGTLRHLEPGFFTVGLQVSQFALRRPGLDLAIGIAPTAIAAGGLGARAGVAVPLPLGSRAVIMPVVGGSAIGSTIEGSSLFGVNGGASLLLGDPSRAMPRISVTAHRFNGVGELLWLLELGFAGLMRRS